MDLNISPLLMTVNKPAVLTQPINANKLTNMRYGERLRAARKSKGWTQQMLADAAKINQSLISQLEKSLTATGSEYTPRIARAMKINVDWLADEIGEMVPTVYGRGPSTSLTSQEPQSPPPLSVVENNLPAQVSAFAKRIAALPPHLWPGIDNAIKNMEAVVAAGAIPGNNK